MFLGINNGPLACRKKWRRKIQFVSQSFTDARHSVYILEALMKAIADKLIPGLPDNLRILLVSQVHDEDEEFLLAGDDGNEPHDSRLTVTQRVVKSDRRREKAMKEQQR